MGTEPEAPIFIGTLLLANFPDVNINPQSLFLIV